MFEKVKDVIVTLVFVVILASLLLLNFIVKDKDISTSERRSLQKFPNISLDNILNGNFSDKFENYAMDQMPFRDSIRSIKTLVKLDILRQKDNNGLFILDNVIYKSIYPLNEKSVQNVASKINNIYDKYLTENDNVYYMIVPDKNYYLDEKSNYLKIDYNKLEKIMNDNVNSNIKYISVLDELENIDSYYNTDTHWRQDKIVSTGTFEKITTAMNINDRIKTPFIPKTYDNFYGAYYGQLGKNVAPDIVTYLTNDVIDSATTYNYEKDKEAEVYDILQADSSMDKYDLFLSGATPIIEIRNEMAENDKQLVIFRDSFGSSLAPLFTEAYSKIILVDTRYISTDLIEKYIEFDKNQDILFEYSTLIINESSTLK